MPTETIDVQEAQADFTKLLALVLEGTEVILVQGDTLLARMVPIALTSRPRVAGIHEGAIWTSDDFDEPVPEEFWVGAV